MRRFIALSTLALAAVAFQPAVSHAQTPPNICTATVYVEPGLGISSENAELRSATNLLSSRGVDARILLLQDLDGASDVSEYRRTSLVPQCPEFDQSVRADNLYIAIMAIPMREKGAVFGESMERIHNEDLFSSTANPYFRDASENNRPELFATGLHEYFEKLQQRIDQGTRASEGPPQTQAGSAPGEPVNLRWLWILLGTLGTLCVLGALGFFGYRAYSAWSARRDRKADMQSTLESLTNDHTNLATESDDEMLDINQWIDLLPDSDDGELKLMSERITTAIASGKEAIYLATSALSTAKSDQDLDNAQVLLDKAEGLIGHGMSALTAAGPMFDDLRAKHDGFAARHAEALNVSGSITQARNAAEAKGFRMEAYDREHAASLAELTRALALFDQSAIVSAANILDTQEIALVQQHSTLLALPGLPGKLEAEADRLAELHTTLTRQAQQADTVMTELRQQYHPDDISDLAGVPGETQEVLARAHLLIEAGKTAATMEAQQFDDAQARLQSAHRELAEAKSLVQIVMNRPDELDVLRDSLTEKLTNLRSKASTVAEYIRDRRADLSRKFEEESDRLTAVVNNFDLHIDSKPSYKKLSQELDEIDADLDGCYSGASRQYQTAVDAVATAKRNAESRLSDARRYRDHSAGRYRRANDDFFTGALVGMTLQQQLNHWNQAHAAADAAYDYGRSHVPVSTPSYSSGSSGGDTNSSWSSPSVSSGGGGGGDTNSSW